MRHSKPMYRKFSLRPVLILLLILVIGVTGTVFAYMFKRTEIKENSLVPAKVSCAVQEEFNSEQKSSIKIENTGNIDSYLRVRLVSYWVDGSGNVVAKPSEMPAVSVASGWIHGSDNTYYYHVPIAPDAQTPELLASPVVLTEDSDGNRQVLDVFAEAIQSKPESAVKESWGVTLGANGSIATAP